MCRNLLVLVLCLVLGMATYAKADSPVQLGDWEQSMDTWIDQNPTGQTLTYSQTGVTSGSYSLRESVAAIMPGGNDWWNWGLSYQFLGDARQDFLDNTLAQIDVTTLAAENTPDPGAGWLFGVDYTFTINCGDNHGHNFFDVKNYTHWDPTVADTTLTVSADYAAERNLVAGWTASGWMGDGSWCEIWLQMRIPTITKPVVFYLDNAWITPEPATMALLGLGGLALIRRKR